MTLKTQAGQPFAASKSTITVHSSLLFDSRRAQWVKNRSVVVDPSTGLITRVYERSGSDLPAADDDGGTAIDARELVLLPGLVDSHTHIFLHAYSEASSLNQERDESLVERTVRATQHCRAALRAGYTTYRDLGTEGAGDADVGVRDAINRGITPGPRLLVATQPLATSGSYAVRHEAALNGTRAPPTSDECDGVDGVTAGVRRRVGAGADVIKFYADYRRRTLRFPPPPFPGAGDILAPPAARARNPNSTLFNQAEMDAICAEARRANIPVAAHASEPEAVLMAAKAGVASIEHGFVPLDEVITQLAKSDTIFVPTLSVAELYKDELKKGLLGPSVGWKDVLEHTRRAWLGGVRIATGGDTGAFAHGNNAREIELLVEAGLPLEAALQAATIRGWEACGGSLKDEYQGETVVGRKFGSLESGWAADLVAVRMDPREDMAALRSIGWVMKDGQMEVEDGRILRDG